MISVALGRCSSHGLRRFGLSLRNCWSQRCFLGSLFLRERYRQNLAQRQICLSIQLKLQFPYSLKGSKPLLRSRRMKRRDRDHAQRSWRQEIPNRKLWIVQEFVSSEWV